MALALEKWILQIPGAFQLQTPEQAPSMEIFKDQLQNNFSSKLPCSFLPLHQVQILFNLLFAVIVIYY